MAVTQKLKSGVTVTWGTSGVSAQSNGKLLSASVRHSAQSERVPDEEGHTVGVIYFDETDELTLEILCASSVTLPSVGDTIDCGGVTGYVESYEVKWEHRATKKLSVNAINFSTGGIPAQA